VSPHHPLWCGYSYINNVPYWSLYFSNQLHDLHKKVGYRRLLTISLIILINYPSILAVKFEIVGTYNHSHSHKAQNLLTINHQRSKLQIKSSVCLYVCSPLITFEPLDRFHEIWYGGNVIQVDLGAIIFNRIGSIILILLRIKFVRWTLLNCGFGSFFCFMVTID
jgi:hypothetical protein